MANKKTTSPSIASLASKVLQDSQASNAAKSLAGSALSQVNKGNETGKQLEHLASTVLNSDKFNEASKALAGSILSQSDKKR